MPHYSLMKKQAPKTAQERIRDEQKVAAARLKAQSAKQDRAALHLQAQIITFINALEGEARAKYERDNNVTLPLYSRRL
jgi:hypothetical protein